MEMGKMVGMREDEQHVQVDFTFFFVNFKNTFMNSQLIGDFQTKESSYNSGKRAYIEYI